MHEFDTRLVVHTHTPTTTVVETPENWRMNETISRFTRFTVLSLSPDDVAHLSVDVIFLSCELVSLFFRLCDSVISLAHSGRVCLVFSVYPVLRSTINFDVIVVWIYAASFFHSSVAKTRGKIDTRIIFGEFVYSPDENKLNEWTRNWISCEWFLLRSIRYFSVHKPSRGLKHSRAYWEKQTHWISRTILFMT